MHITKTLFTEFTTTPKLAWFHMHDKETYNQILEAEYGAMDGAQIGQSIEDQVKALLGTHTIVTPEGDYDACATETQQLLASQPAVIYQPRFQSDNLMIRCDFLVRNAEGTYDLREVKAKNTVRKTTKAEPLLDELISDISFQKYVLEQTLGSAFSGKCVLVYLNKDYVRQGDLDIAQLIKTEEVTHEMMTSEQVSQIITTMQAQLPLEREAFETIYPYNNDDYLTYFGEPAPKGSIRYIPGIGNKKKTLYESGMTDILTLGEQEKKLLLSSKGEVSKASQYVDLYQQGETVINTDGVKNKLSQLHYPLFFYDYETVTSPVPLFDGTSPRQHIVVQYSVHKIDADGTITHKEALIDGSIANNKAIIDQLYHDLEGGQGSYIVWFKGFENKRNEETALMYPEYKTFFETVNANTFDLMEVFSEFHYFDRRFKGSASIKKVLPVLTDITYDGLEVPNGAVATGLLLDIATGKLTGESLATHRDNLLTYCEQDTWAMVRIWQELKKHIPRRESIINLDSNEAKKYFLKSNNYCNLELPIYFDFSNLLNVLDTSLLSNPVSTQEIKEAKKYENLNYKLLNNKDGKYARRNLELINPVLYVGLVQEITQSQNWTELQNRFKFFSENGCVDCKSMPVISLSEEKDKAEQILNRLDLIEKESVKLALEFDYMFEADIANCYDSIYTHSIPWSIHGIAIAKLQRFSDILLGNKIDTYIQAMSYGQTNGIPQGSVLMDFIAEMVLGFADVLLNEKISDIDSKEYKILRYRDDYRIFVLNPQIGERILKELTIVLETLNMRLNAQKTKHTDNIIENALKQDKYHNIVTGSIKNKSIRDELILIYSLSERYPNTGLIRKKLSKLHKKISIVKGLNDDDIVIYVSILTSIGLKNPKVYPDIAAILSKLIQLNNKNGIEMLKLIVQKFQKIPNTGYLDIWLQRITIKLEDIFSYDEGLCKVVLDKDNSKIREYGFSNPRIIQIMNDNTIIDDDKLNSLESIISDEEIKLFRSSYTY